jgi:sugar/nucleoside kinase (ribokinase family)
LDRPPRIAVVGDAGVDLTFRVSQGADEKAAVVDAERGLGGTGANAAVAAALLGADVRITGAIGDDALGPWVSAALAARNVATDLVRTTPGRTEVAVVVIEDGLRRLFVDPGIAYQHDRVAILELRSWADVLYLTHVEPELVRAAGHGTGALVVIGVEAAEMVTGDWRRSLEHADLVLTNSAGAERVLAVVDAARTSVVITAGAAGAELVGDGSRTEIPAPSVIAVDATGAGDCFAATLCVELGLGRDLPSAVRWGVLAASLSTTRLGTQTAFPTTSELDEFAAANPLR